MAIIANTTPTIIPTIAPVAIFLFSSPDCVSAPFNTLLGVLLGFCELLFRDKLTKTYKT